MNAETCKYWHWQPQEGKAGSCQGVAQVNVHDLLPQEGSEGTLKGLGGPPQAAHGERKWGTAKPPGGLFRPLMGQHLHPSLCIVQPAQPRPSSCHSAWRLRSRDAAATQ